MAINLLGDGVRDALDPRLRSGALTRPMPATTGGPQGPVPPAEARPAGGPRTWRPVPRQGPGLQGRGRGRPEREARRMPGHHRRSGSGKSVTALSVMGLVASPPGVITGGAVRLRGRGSGRRALRGRCAAMRGRPVAYIFQDPLATLHPLYRVGDQLAEAIRRIAASPAAEGRAKASTLLKGGAHPQRRGAGSTATRTRCRAACASASASPWRWPTTPR
jgi:peptide/nickel transport system permease protein